MLISYFYGGFKRCHSAIASSRDGLGLLYTVNYLTAAGTDWAYCMYTVNYLTAELRIQTLIHPQQIFFQCQYLSRS